MLPNPPPPLPSPAALTDVPLDGNLPEALLEAGVEGAGRAAAVPLGGGGHGGAGREHAGLPAAPVRFTLSRQPVGVMAAATPREEAEAMPPPSFPPSPPRWAPGRAGRAAAAEGLTGCSASEVGQSCFVQEFNVRRFQLVL